MISEIWLKHLERVYFLKFPNRIPFPTIVICSQTSHSKKKISRFYPQLNESLIWKLYGNCGPSCDNDEIKKWEQKKLNWRYKSADRLERQLAEDKHAWRDLNKINLTEFMFKTRPIFSVWTCTLGHLNCKYAWKNVNTYLGTCLQLSSSDVKDGRQGDSVSMFLPEKKQDTVRYSLYYNTNYSNFYIFHDYNNLTYIFITHCV